LKRELLSGVQRGLVKNVVSKQERIMNIKYKRKPENEEMMAIYEFFKKYRNHIGFLLIAIAVTIVSVSIYSTSKQKNEKIAADRLFEINKAFLSEDDSSVISKGTEYADKFSGFDSAGDILILVARSHMRKNDTDAAISVLEKNKSLSSNETFKFSVFNVLGGLYMDKWMTEKNPDLAEKAGDYYLKASQSDRELHKERTLYFAGNCFVQAGKTDKARKALKPLYDNSKDLEYKLREQVKFLYENID
jgi:predicted negative regulator of RcsB-dependent stress response